MLYLFGNVGDVLIKIRILINKYIMKSMAPSNGSKSKGVGPQNQLVGWLVG